jgi:fumarylacetoacetase
MKPMSRALDETHDPDLTSWVESANAPQTDFPIQNLPFGVFRRKHSAEKPRVGTAIGELVLDIAACGRAGVLGDAALAAAEACQDPALNALMALGPTYWAALRRELHRLLRAGTSDVSRNQELLSPHLLPVRHAELLVPARIGDYTDFYASVHHATNVGSMFRPGNPLLPNYKYVPIAYHGRASSIVPSGTVICRPKGQALRNASEPPVFESSRRLDYELEIGFFIGPGNSLGHPIPLKEAEQHIFGICLVNDWSARDIQAWEYQPLGPFLGKNFATTISPWVVTLEALAPFRVPQPARPAGDPAPLPYLASPGGEDQPAFDLTLDVWFSSRRMRELGFQPVRLSQANARDLYWTIAQMVAHHTSNGCNLRPGDLLASGTVSGSGKESRGSLLEIAWNGKEPLPLPTGEIRAFLEDQDEVILHGYSDRPGFRRIGLGECRGLVQDPQ